MEKIPMTRAGFDQLDLELRDLKAVERPAVIRAIAEARDAVEDVIEPYLIQQGFLVRTARGRMATLAAFQHLGLQPPASNGGLFEA